MYRYIIFVWHAFHSNGKLFLEPFGLPTRPHKRHCCIMFSSILFVLSLCYFLYEYLLISSRHHPTARKYVLFKRFYLICRSMCHAPLCHAPAVTGHDGTDIQRTDDNDETDDVTT